jgi:glutaredoxin
MIMLTQSFRPSAGIGFPLNHIAAAVGILFATGLKSAGMRGIVSVFPSFRSDGMPELMLYYFPSCPYCRLVLDCLDRLGLEISMRDIQSEPGARDDLLEIGGKGQVPCLVIDGKPLYESGDIVRWLEAHAG